MKRLFVLLAVVILLLIVFFPFLASTPLVKPLFVKAFETAIGGNVEIGSLRLSWFGPQKFQYLHFTTPDLQGSLDELEANGPLWSLTNLDGKTFGIKNGSLSFPSYGDGSIEQINGKRSGDDLELTGITRQDDASGHLSLKGKVYSKKHFALTLNLTKFPVAALDRFFKGNHLIYQALGSSIDLNGTANLENNQGTVHLNLSSSNIETAIKANLTENSITLAEPLTASLRLTPELSQQLLSGVNPLFLTGIEGKNPVSLHIDSNGFFFPLPFSLEKLQAKGTLDVGQIVCRNGKTLASIISLLKAERFSDAKTMNGWFTPISFQIHDGTVYTDRMDALFADSIHICTWGRINLISDNLHMNLGIPADTLKQSFGIKNISDTYVLKVHIRGTTKNPDIEKGAAAAKIAALLAAQNIPIKKKGLLGGIVNTLSTAKEDKDIPKAQRPFPWER